MRAAETERDRQAAQAEAAARAGRERADQEFEDALTTLAAEIAELRRNFARLVDQVGRVGDAGKHGLAAAMQAASTEGLGISERAKAELGGEFQGIREDLVRTAKEHPWRTLALAGIGGLVIGLAMRR